MQHSETRKLPILNTNVSTPIKRHHHRHNVKSRYDFIKTLGKGTYGKVRLARHKETNQLVAVKAIRKDKVKDSVDMKHIRREMEIMSSLQHPHIIQIYEVFENQDKIVIVMEYAAGGELYDYLASRSGVSDDEARSYFRQIVSAVRYCHQRGIVHRDLKLENILLDEDRRIKIADFGLANLYKTDSLLNTFCGSPLYASPEIVCGVPYSGPEVDSWSLGVLLYALVYGTMPFDGRNFNVLTKQITSGNFCKPSKLSDAHDLICWMLTVDAQQRATIDDIAGHAWVDLLEDTVLTPPVTQSASSFTDYLQSAVELADTNEDMESTLKAEDSNSEESNPPKGILKRNSASIDEDQDAAKSKTSVEDDDLAGQLAAVCGLHAKDSLKLKSKPHGASGKRRVLRSKRDRESGYYSSPERASAAGDKVDPAGSQRKNVPVIKPSLVVGGQLARLTTNQRPSVAPKPAKECYLVPLSSGVEERLASVSSDDGCSVGSQTRPASTYSDSSILSSDSFDLCTFDKTQFARSEQAAPATPHRPSPLLLPSTQAENRAPIDERPQGTLTPKSEKFVRDIKRILAPSGRRHRDAERVHPLEPIMHPQSLDENSQLSTMVNQLNVDLDVAYKKAIDICANLRSAEV